MKYLIVLPLVLLSTFCKGQEKFHTFSLSYGTGNGDFSHYTRGVSGSGIDHDGKSVNIFGLNYFGGMGKNLYLETGLSLLEYNYTSRYFIKQPEIITSNRVKALAIPLKVRFEFGKFFFLNGGALVDIALDKGDENVNISGLGAGIGGGIQYFHQNRLGIFVNPQLNFRGLLSFGNNMGLLERNITFGVAYRFTGS